MKRWMCMLLCFVMLCLMPTAYAAEENREWVFRNGVTWSSTKEDVMDSEDGEAETDEAGRMSVLTYEDVSVSKYSGKLAYIFDEDRLLGVGYRVYSLTEEDTDYLRGALTSKYGAAFCGDEEYIHLLIQSIAARAGNEAGGGTATEEIDAVWRLEDGTLIFLSQVPVFGGYTVIWYYLNEAYLLENSSLYNTDGL